MSKKTGSTLRASKSDRPRSVRARHADASVRQFASDLIVNQLLTTAESALTTHAILLSGPRGIGKTTLAVDLARRFVCLDGNSGAACGVCASCKAMLDRKHPDVTIIENEEDHLGITVIREITQSFSRRPVLSNRHVAIIDRAERMTEEAANAFLKSLEEPSGHTVYLLTTDQVFLLPQTVVSRCSVINLTLTPETQLASLLTDDGVRSNDAREMAVFSDGRSAYARRLLQDERAFSEARKDSLLLIDLLTAPVHERLATTETIATQKDAVGPMLALIERWESVLRRIMKASVGVVDRGPDAQRLVTTTRTFRSPHAVIEMIDGLHQLKSRVRSSGNIRLTLESFALHLPMVRV